MTTRGRAKPVLQASRCTYVSTLKAGVGVSALPPTVISEVCWGPPLAHAITEWLAIASLVFVNIQASKHSALWSLGGVSTTSTILSSSNSRLDPRQHGSKAHRLYLVFICVPLCRRWLSDRESSALLVFPARDEAAFQRRTCLVSCTSPLL